MESVMVVRRTGILFLIMQSQITNLIKFKLADVGDRREGRCNNCEFNVVMRLRIIHQYLSNCLPGKPGPGRRKLATAENQRILFLGR